MMSFRSVFDQEFSHENVREAHVAGKCKLRQVNTVDTSLHVFTVIQKCFRTKYIAAAKYIIEIENSATYEQPTQPTEQKLA